MEIVLGFVLLMCLFIAFVVVRFVNITENLRSKLHLTEALLSHEKITHFLYKTQIRSELLKMSHHQYDFNIDDTTKKLIALAVNNTNDNEAKNAALNACKRIAKNNLK